MAIMVCFDFADIFLPLAKALRYLRLGDSFDRLPLRNNLHSRLVLTAENVIRQTH